MLPEKEQQLLDESLVPAAERRRKAFRIVSYGTAIILVLSCVLRQVNPELVSNLGKLFQNIILPIMLAFIIFRCIGRIETLASICAKFQKEIDSLKENKLKKSP